MVGLKTKLACLDTLWWKQFGSTMSHLWMPLDSTFAWLEKLKNMLSFLPPWAPTTARWRAKWFLLERQFQKTTFYWVTTLVSSKLQYAQVLTFISTCSPCNCNIKILFGHQQVGARQDGRKNSYVVDAPRRRCCSLHTLASKKAKTMAPGSNMFCGSLSRSNKSSFQQETKYSKGCHAFFFKRLLELQWSIDTLHLIHLNMYSLNFQVVFSADWAATSMIFYIEYTRFCLTVAACYRWASLCAISCESPFSSAFQQNMLFRKKTNKTENEPCRKHELLKILISYL